MKKTTQSKQPSLQLKTENVRVLTAAELQSVAGGVIISRAVCVQSGAGTHG